MNGMIGKGKGLGDQLMSIVESLVVMEANYGEQANRVLGGKVRRQINWLQALVEGSEERETYHGLVVEGYGNEVGECWRTLDETPRGGLQNDALTQRWPCPKQNKHRTRRGRYA